MIYFLADFLWIAWDQKCVKSVTPLLVHHIVSATYSLLPYFYPEVQEKMCYVMLVEVRCALPMVRDVIAWSATVLLTWCGSKVRRMLGDAGSLQVCDVRCACAVERKGCVLTHVLANSLVTREARLIRVT